MDRHSTMSDIEPYQINPSAVQADPFATNQTSKGLLWLTVIETEIDNHDGTSRTVPLAIASRDIKALEFATNFPNPIHTGIFKSVSPPANTEYNFKGTISHWVQAIGNTPHEAIANAIAALG